MNGVVQLLTRFGAARLGAMGAVTLALVGFFAFVILRMSQPAMGVLFTDMSSSDAASVVRELDARGVRYDLKEDGQTILAPRPELSRLRMELAGKGLPSSGGVGYEIFDKGDAFSSTSFVQNINQLRALEGELGRSIRTIGRVQSARVHLAIPERRLFERDREPPRASIVLKLRGDLGAEQVQAIRHLAASAVEGLTPERVSIVDERGRLLADGTGSAAGVAGSMADEKRVGLERRLRGQAEEIMTGIVGPGRARVQVAAELDLARVESRSENFDPESRVVRSTQTRGENQSTSSSEGQVSVGNELPGARDQAAAGAAAAPKDASAKNEETVNYEISRTTRTEVQEAGRIRRLSVAVLVDGARTRKDGKDSYQPRSPEDLARIAALVRSAVGFDKARGDQVEVVNMPFADAAPEAEVAEVSLLDSLLHPGKDDVLRAAEIGIVTLLTLIVLMVVVRPMVRRVLAPDLLAPAPALALAGGAAVAGTIAPPAEGPAEVNLPPGLKTAGLVAAAQIKNVGDIAKSNPRETAAVLKNWMAER